MTNSDHGGLARILNFDALTCAAMGLFLLLGSGPIAGITAIPATLLFYAGAILIPIAIYMALVARAGTGSPLAVWLVILGNLGWVVASVALFGVIAPNGLGVALILGQAAVVGLLAWLEYRAWRGISARARVTA
ncbi:hypothetical protein [Tabrizicola sp.]|uniref:hypothetical protein n=1 Tax=Tabrizicola sp. TaxID=2005166 RepID=UPI003F35FFDD